MHYIGKALYITPMSYLRNSVDYSKELYKIAMSLKNEINVNSNNYGNPLIDSWLL